MPRPSRSTPEFREKNRAYQNAWYHANKGSALETRKKRLNSLRQKYQQYKANLQCTVCGESHPACLEFHHPDPSTKDVDPGNIVSRKGWTWPRIEEELRKLHVLCANCHRKEHARLKAEN